MFSRPLKAGDTIAVAAPASPFDRNRFATGVRVLRDLGFHVRIPDAVRDRDAYLAGPDRQRARLITELFADPGVRLIWCARGGYGSMRMLPFLDYEFIRAHPKPLIGSSDATALLTALYSRCRMPVFHGPMVVTLADGDEAARDSVCSVFTAAAVPVIEAAPVVPLHPGRASGVVTGGNLATLTHLIGTPFEPDFSGHLLFLEDIREAPYRIDRMLTQMKMAGKLSRISGLLLGRFLECGSMEQVHAVVENICKDLDIPVLAQIPAGHGQPNVILPMGVEATLDADAGILRYHEPTFGTNQGDR